MSDCRHLEVTRTHSAWTCARCEQPFYPQEVLDEVEARADVVAAAASALLWDFHTRAIEKYGIGVSTGPATKSDPICADFGHRYGDQGGKCVVCSFSPFLGEDDASQARCETHDCWKPGGHKGKCDPR